MPNEDMKRSEEEVISPRRTAVCIGSAVLVLIGAVLAIYWFFNASEEMDNLRPIASDVNTSSVRRDSSHRAPKNPAPSPGEEKAKETRSNHPDRKATELEVKAIEKYIAVKSLTFLARGGDILLSEEDTKARGLPARPAYPLDSSTSVRPHFALLTVRGFRYANGGARPTKENVDEEIPKVTLWTMDDQELLNPVEVVKRDVRCNTAGTIERYRAAHVATTTWFRIRDLAKLEGTTVRVRAFWRGMTKTIRIAVTRRDIKLQFAIWDETHPDVFHLMLLPDDSVAFDGIRSWKVTVRDAEGRLIRVEPTGKFDLPNEKTEEGIAYWKKVAGTYDFDLELIDGVDIRFPLTVQLDIEDPFGVKKSAKAKLYAPVRKKD